MKITLVFPKNVSKKLQFCHTVAKQVTTTVTIICETQAIFFENERENRKLFEKKFKLIRAQGECLGIRSRRRT